MKSFDKLPENMCLDPEKQEEFRQTIKKRNAKAITQESTSKGVVYIGHIPHGFFEPQMKQYFSQFGDVTRLRISRSKKTGKVKGYGFVEFASDTVAQVVADTMNNYLMFHRLLKCEHVATEKVHPDTFKGSERRFLKPKAHLVAAQRHNKQRTSIKEKAATKRLVQKKRKCVAALAEMGIEYDLPVTKQNAVTSKSKGVAESTVVPDISSDEIPAKKTKQTATKNEESKKLAAAKRLAEAVSAELSQTSFREAPSDSKDIARSKPAAKTSSPAKATKVLPAPKKKTVKDVPATETKTKLKAKTKDSVAEKTPAKDSKGGRSKRKAPQTKKITKKPRIL